MEDKSLKLSKDDTGILINEDDSSKINTLPQYITLILEKLGIDGNIKNEILLEFKKYDDNTTFKVMNKFNEKVGLINTMINFDNKINSLIDSEDLKFLKTDTNFMKNWEITKQNLARLQGLIILRKITKDCDKGVDAMIQALDDKLNAVNNIIESSFDDSS